MNDEIQVVSTNLPAPVTPQTVFTHTGDNGLQIANQGTVNIFQIANNGSVYNTGNTISTEYYNLIVVSDDAIYDPFVLVRKERALTISEGVAPDISERFAALTPEALSEIKTFPSLLVSENRQYGRTDADQLAFFGFVTDVRIQDNGIKVYFQRLSAFPQQRLNEIAFNLSIQGSPSFNELNRMHWAIKRIHLLEEFKVAGISVLLPT